MKKQPIWKIILVIIIAVLVIKFSINYGDKVAEETAQRTVKRMMEMKKQAAEKDTPNENPIQSQNKLNCFLLNLSKPCPNLCFFINYDLSKYIIKDINNTMKINRPMYNLFFSFGVIPLSLS